MAQTREQRGEKETKAAVAKVKKTGKATGGARGGITAPVTPSPELADILATARFRGAKWSRKSGPT